VIYKLSIINFGATILTPASTSTSPLLLDQLT